MYQTPPPNKTYWPGPESHEAYVDKNKLPNTNPNPNIPSCCKNKSKIPSSESHSSKQFTCGCGVTREK